MNDDLKKAIHRKMGATPEARSVLALSQAAWSRAFHSKQGISAAPGDRHALATYAESKVLAAALGPHEEHLVTTGQVHPEVAAHNIEAMRRAPYVAPSPDPWAGASTHEDGCGCGRCAHLEVNGASAQ